MAWLQWSFKDDLMLNILFWRVLFAKVPVPHFGVVLEWKQFEDFAKRLLEHDVQVSAS